MRRRLWRWRGPKIKVMVIALYRCGAVLVVERRYKSALKLKVCSTAGRSGDKQTILWERLDRHDSVTDIELAVAAH